MASKVVAIKKIKPSLSNARYGALQWRDLIRQDILAEMRNGVRMRDIAAACKLCPQTISNIVSLETKLPRMAAVPAILQYLGYTLFAVKE